MWLFLLLSHVSLTAFPSSSSPYRYSMYTVHSFSLLIGDESISHELNFKEVACWQTHTLSHQKKETERCAKRKVSPSSGRFLRWNFQLGKVRTDHKQQIGIGNDDAIIWTNQLTGNAHKTETSIELSAFCVLLPMEAFHYLQFNSLQVNWIPKECSFFIAERNVFRSPRSIEKEVENSNVQRSAWRREYRVLGYCVLPLALPKPSPDDGLNTTVVLLSNNTIQ